MLLDFALFAMCGCATFDELAAIAPTNTVEFLIGAGMRQDVEKLNEVTK